MPVHLQVQAAVPLRVPQPGKPAALVGALAASDAELALLATQPAVKDAAGRSAAEPAAVAEPAALNAEHVAAIPALQAAAEPVAAAAQPHKAVGTGVAATDEQPHAPGR